MPFRAGKTMRISSRKESSELFRRGIRAGDSRLLLIGRANENPAGPPRCVVTVSKRHGNAVRRNRLKRLSREAFRLQRPFLPAGFDFALLPNVGKDLDLKGLMDSLSHLAGRIERKWNRRQGASAPPRP